MCNLELVQWGPIATTKGEKMKKSLGLGQLASDLFVNSQNAKDSVINYAPGLGGSEDQNFMILTVRNNS